MVKNKMDSIRAHVFKYSKEDFLESLRENGIEYFEQNLSPTGTIVASGEAVEIIKALGSVSIIPAIASVLIQWLKGRNSRKIILQTKDREIIHLQGYSVKEVESLLEKAENITVIQTTPDD